MSNSAQPGAEVKELTVAICGNPNCGKTTIFNAITGLRQKVGNYPGVTVEKITGRFDVKGYPDLSFHLVDTPGSYSLAAFSPDEYIATRALCGDIRDSHRPDIVVCVIDSTNIERGLYLLFQILEVGRPVVVALNMTDVAERNGLTIDNEKLSQSLGGLPVIKVIGSRRVGISQLQTAIAETARHPRPPEIRGYDDFSQSLVREMVQSVSDGHRCNAEYLRVIFDESGPAELLFVEDEGEKASKLVDDMRARLRRQYGTLSAGETHPLTTRASQITAEVVSGESRHPLNRSEKVDRVLLHPIGGPLILMSLMVVMFQAVFSWAEPLMGFIEATFGALSGVVEGSMADGPLRSLLTDGIIGGVGSVLVFLPQIIILFFFISVLEDSGYMPRAAFLVDRLFGWCGLSGKSFVPMLSSFACAVPGIMATRTIENRKLRLITIMVAPLMSCSARLPVYTIMIAAFIPHETYLGLFNSRGLVLTGLYALGLSVAVIVSFIMNRLIYRNERGTFMMEMPTYNVPTGYSVVIRILNRVKDFVVRAGTVILAITVLIWLLSYYPRSEGLSSQFESDIAAIETLGSTQVLAIEQQIAGLPTEPLPEVRSAFEGVSTVEEVFAQRRELIAAHPEHSRAISLISRTRQIEIEAASQVQSIERNRAGALLRDSYFGRLGRLLEPLFRPLGWDWKITMATLASFPAREVIIATMGTIYNLGAEEDESSTSLVEKMQVAKWDHGEKRGQPVFSVAVALSVMVFFALCAQCGATLATIKHETSSWMMPVLSFVYMTALAYVGGLITYQFFSSVGL